MAVGSINNKINGKNSKNKYATKRKKKTIKKADVINELIFELENVIVLKEREIARVQRKKKINKRILFITTILICILIYILMPKIHLSGAKEIIINYNEKYLEKGYNAKFLWKNITKKVKVKSNFDNNQVGEYEIEYYLKRGIFEIKKTRKIKVVDNITPNIFVDDEIINICPNDEVPDVKFSAIDEYEGDLSNRVKVNKFDDKIILSVSDSSNNMVNREIPVDREDKTKPEIKLKGNTITYINVGVSYQEPGYTANDNCDGDISDKVKVSGNVSTSAGTYKLTYSVSDNNNQVEVTRTVIVRNSNLYNDGTIGNGVIYLTFDDGPSNGTTNVILDILKEEGVKATFFVTCSGPDYLIKRIYDEGHTLALHTCTHDYGTVYSSVDNYFNDLNRVSNRVKNITGYESKIIRFPGGSSNTVSRSYAYGIMSTLTGMVLDRGYRYYDWNVDSNDAGGANTSSQVYNNVMSSISHGRGNVVLMHDIKYQTRDALRSIIRDAKSNGFTFSKITMDTYMVRHGVNN